MNSEFPIASDVNWGPSRLQIDRRALSVPIEPKTKAAIEWDDSFTRVESPDGVSCFEQRDELSQVLGRVWCKSYIEIDQVEGA